MQKTLALILKKQNLGETDRIMTIFSPTLGKKRVIARAARKPLSKLAGHLDTFMVSQIMLTDHEDLPKITSAVLVESFENIRGTYSNLEKAFAISKIIERVIIEDVSQQTIFQISVDALARLNDEEPWHNVWLAFLSTLTRNLGLTTSNFECLKCHEKLAGKGYWLVDDRGFHCQNCGAPRADYVTLQENSMKMLYLMQKKNYMIQGQSNKNNGLESRPYANFLNNSYGQWSAIRQVNIPESVAKEVEEVFLREITEWFNKPWIAYSGVER